MEKVTTQLLAKKKARCAAQFLIAAEKRDYKKLIKQIRSPYLDVHAAVDYHGNTPLHIVANVWPSSTVKPLVERGAFIDARNVYGQTPLHLAVMLGQFYDMDHFINVGADVNAQDAKGNTPLHRAFLLAQYYETLPRGEQRRVLSNDVYYKIKELIKCAHARINIKNVQGWLPAEHDDSMIRHFAYGPFVEEIQKADCEATKRILAQGINVNVHHLCEAIESDSTAIVRLLLDKSEDLSFEEVSWGCKSAEMAYFLITYVSHALMRAQWNKVAVPLLCTSLLRGLPADVQKRICIYCVFPGIVAEQHRRSEMGLKTLQKFPVVLENKGLNALLEEERFSVTKLWQYFGAWESQVKPVLAARAIKL